MVQFFGVLVALFIGRADRWILAGLPVLVWGVLYSPYGVWLLRMDWLLELLVFSIACTSVRIWIAKVHHD
jgi:hypothetical protein